MSRLFLLVFPMLLLLLIPNQSLISGASASPEKTVVPCAAEDDDAQGYCVAARVPEGIRASTILHVWIRANGSSTPNGEKARLWVRHSDCPGDPETFKDTLVAETEQSAEYKFFDLGFAVSDNANNNDCQTVWLVWEEPVTSVSYAYVFEPGTVLDQGIRIVHVNEAAQGPQGLPDGSYHFRAPLGWINDPNGFMRIGDRYHLFYQHYPHARHWMAMHWGHAVSRDLLNWIHLPIFMQPDPDVVLKHKGGGGIFSGGAIPLEEGSEGFRVFFTDHLDNRQPMEFQRSGVSLDGEHLDAAPVVLRGVVQPKNLSLTQGFRDPHVVRGPDGRWLLVLGSEGLNKGGGRALLYRTDDPKAAGGWYFVGMLHEDPTNSMENLECPGLLPLSPNNEPLGPGERASKDTLWVFYYGQYGSTEPSTGKRFLSQVYVGHFDGERFEPVFHQEMDFGTYTYAFQSSEIPEGHPLGFGWLGNWADVPQGGEDHPTTMTLPRRLKLRADKKALLIQPSEHVLALRRTRFNVIDALKSSDGKVKLPEGGIVELELKLAEPLEKGEELTLWLEHSTLDGVGIRLSPAEGLEILQAKQDKRPHRLIAAGANPTQFRVFLDVGSIEVYADEGRWTGTYRLPDFPRWDELGVFTESKMTTSGGEKTRDKLTDAVFWKLNPHTDEGKNKKSIVKKAYA